MIRDPIDLTSPTYTPIRLLDKTAEILGCKNDAALAYVLEIDRSQLSRIRRRREPVNELFLVQIMDRTGQHIQEVRELAGIPFDGPAPPSAPLGIPAKPPKPVKQPVERKLNASKVRAIRLDTRARTVIAREYGITQQHVWYVQKRLGWKHVE